MGSTKLIYKAKEYFFLNINRCLVAYFRGAMKKLQKGQMLNTVDPINTASFQFKLVKTIPLRKWFSIEIS